MTCTAIECDTFNTQHGWILGSEIIGGATTIWQLLLTIYYWKNFMMVEMTNDDLSGWLHVHVFKYIESLWEKPLSWVCRLVCLEMRTDDFFTRRISTKESQKESGSKLVAEMIYNKQSEKIKKSRAGKLELALFVAIHVGTELFQRVLDIPYLGGLNFSLGDCDGLGESRQIKKPVFYYVLYILIECYGTFLYTFYVRNFIVPVTEKGEYTHSYAMSQVMFSMMELPSLMLLEFFFHERLTSSDGLFSNKMVALNNIFTLFFVLSLAVVSFDFFMAQVTKPKNGVHFDSGKQDGKLELHELLTILSTLLTMVASILRIFVNQYDNKEKLGPLMLNNTCSEFHWSYIAEFVNTDWAFVVCTILPIAWFHVWLPWVTKVCRIRFLHMVIYDANNNSWSMSIPSARDFAKVDGFNIYHTIPRLRENIWVRIIRPITRTILPVPRRPSSSTSSPSSSTSSPVPVIILPGLFVEHQNEKKKVEEEKLPGHCLLHDVGGLNKYNSFFSKKELKTVSEKGNINSACNSTAQV